MTIERGLFGRLVALRRELHAHPELAGEEYDTARRLERALRSSAVRDVRRMAETAVVARIPGRAKGAPVVALCAAIDGQSITEATGLPYESTTPGVMHACGNDVHAAWAIGAAALLAGRPARGDVLVVLQPSSETGAGARAVLESGVLDAATATFGAQVDRRLAVGQVAISDGGRDIGPAARAAFDAARAVVGESNVVALDDVNMGAGSFAAYLGRMPGAFLLIGAREPGGEVVSARRQDFHADDESIAIGAAVLAECARLAASA